MEIFILVLFIIVLFLIIYLVIGKTILKRKRNITNSTYEHLNNLLKERWSLLPDFIKTIKYELTDSKELLEQLILLRNANYNIMTEKKKKETDTQLTKVLKELSLIIESDISNEKILKLMKELDKICKEIDDSQSKYTKYLEEYKHIRKFFPKFIK